MAVRVPLRPACARVFLPWCCPLTLIKHSGGARVKRLKVGTARRFSASTEKTLVADLRSILDPQCVARAREVATRMTKPAESPVTAADLLENFARVRRAG